MIKEQQLLRIAEYLALAISLKANDDRELYIKANALSWELAATLPADLYKKIGRAVAFPTAELNWGTIIIECRKMIMGNDAGNLSVEDLIGHAPNAANANKENDSAVDNLYSFSMHKNKSGKD